ncbi:MAG TPA: D-alanine--D-alanine ligase [Polyangiaceae bacterium]|nr:D-alanine--D-alanine ligase [Polyangiaceae bacterium]
MTGRRAAVIVGGPSAEAAVSRASGAAVASALAAAGHQVRTLELDAELARRLSDDPPEVVFPTTHGPLGEDGCLQGLLEVLNLPYVGSAVLASALAASKPHAKRLLAAAGLPIAPERLIERGEPLAERAAEARRALGPELVIKPAAGGSAIGVTRVLRDDPDSQVIAALEQALSADASALIEPLLRGHEVTCGVLASDGGDAALPPTLIVSKAADFYDFRSKYAPSGSDHVCPAPFEGSWIERIQALALGAHRAVGARDLSRADAIVAEDGTVTLLEVNTLPGMTQTSLFPEAARAAGIDFIELCDRLLRRAHARPRREAPAAVPIPTG